MELQAERLKSCWVVRPPGKLGTMGWHPEPWEAVFVAAATAEQAVARARRIMERRKMRRATRASRTIRTQENLS